MRKEEETGKEEENGVGEKRRLKKSEKLSIWVIYYKRMVKRENI